MLRAAATVLVRARSRASAAPTSERPLLLRISSASVGTLASDLLLPTVKGLFGDAMMAAQCSDLFVLLLGFFENANDLLLKPKVADSIFVIRLDFILIKCLGLRCC